MTAATRWLEAEGIRGVTGMDLLLFTNRMAPGDSTTVHNHRADLVGIYYARTATTTHNPIQTTDGADYFDAGDGVLLLHDPRFNANLTAAGVPLKAIDIILISHFHPDHINGLKTKDGDKVFPNAQVMVPEPEWKFWMDEANLNAATGPVKKYFLNARRIFRDMAKDV